MDFTELRKKYFLTRENEAECSAWIQRSLQAAFQFLHNKENHKIHSDITLPQLEEIFSDTHFAKDGEPLEVAFQDVLDKVVRHSVRLSNPAYIGHMTGITPYLGIAIDLLTSALNQNVVKIETALSASFVEGQTIAWLHRFIYGREDAYYKHTMHNPDVTLGNMTSGGTLGNLTALAVARNKKLPHVSRIGLAQAMIEGGWNRTVILASTRVHYSVKKAASVLGIGSENVLELPVQPFSNRILVQELESTIESLQKSGALILSLVGIAGSTETGSVDDLQALALLAQKYNIWFHVDGAWGCPILFSKQHKHLFSGIELADSVTIDGHKLFYVPMSCGTVVFKNEQDLDELRHSARYIIRQGSVDHGRTSLEGSRRFDAFKLWFLLKVFGEKGYASLIERSMDLTKEFAQKIEKQKNFELTSAPATNILTYRYIPSSWQKPMTQVREFLQGAFQKPSASTLPEGLIEAANFANLVLNEVNVEIQKQQRQNGKSFVSRTSLESVTPGQETVVFRAVLFNPLTSSQNLADILSEQEDLGNQIAPKRFTGLIEHKPKEFGRFFSNLE